MLRSKKAQAAMEFLMTYGWAILVVLVVIGALAYFGVLDPQRLLPERCTIQTGVTCRNWVVSASNNKIMIEVLNGMGRNIEIDGSSSLIGASGNPVRSCNTTRGYNITTGSSEDVVFDNCDPATFTEDTVSKYRWEIRLVWWYADAGSDYAKTYSGELFAAIQP